MLAEAQKRLFTVEEFHRMGEAGIFDDDVRVELLGGEIFVMPAPGPAHQGDVNALNRVLTLALGMRAVVEVRGPVVLDGYNEPFPDIAVLRPRDDLYRGGHPRPEDILLLVEVADSSLRRDRRDKLPRYAAAGIPEFWLRDVRRRRLENHRDPGPDGYRVTTVHLAGQTISPQAFPDVVLQVSDLLGEG